MFSAVVFTDCERMTHVIAEMDLAHSTSEGSGYNNDDDLTNSVADGSAQFMPPESIGKESYTQLKIHINCVYRFLHFVYTNDTIDLSSSLFSVLQLQLKCVSALRAP